MNLINDNIKHVDKANISDFELHQVCTGNTNKNIFVQLKIMDSYPMTDSQYWVLCFPLHHIIKPFKQ